MRPITGQPSAVSHVADRFADFRVNGGVADDAALADATAPGLELRLDQGDEARAGGRERERRGQDRAQADEARVADDEVDRLRHLSPREVARVGPLQHRDAGIVPQARVKLAITDIDRIDPPRAALAEHICEAAGGGTDIQRGQPAWVDPEMRERVIQLDAAARDPGVIRAPDRERKFALDLHTGLLEPALAGVHPARQQQRLRLGPGLGEAARDQQSVEPLLAPRLAAQWRRSTI